MREVSLSAGLGIVMEPSWVAVPFAKVREEVATSSAKKKVTYCNDIVEAHSCVDNTIIRDS